MVKGKRVYRVALGSFILFLLIVMGLLIATFTPIPVTIEENRW